MKKTIFAILMAASFSAVSSDRIDNSTINYFAERSEVAAELNVEIRALGGFTRIESLVGNKDASANYIIGQMNRLGTGYKQSADMAYKYFSVAANSGHAKASFYLGMLIIGKDPLISINLEMSNSEKINIGYNFIKKSARKGYPQAQFFLSKLYIEGGYYEKDISLALFWLTKATQSGHILAENTRKTILMSKVELGKSYDKIRKKVINGNREAIVDLGKLYLEGYIVPQNYKKAYDLLLSASQLGSKEATSIIIQLEDSYSQEIR